MSRRRHQKGTIQERNGTYRGIYRKYPEGKLAAIPLGTAAEGMTKRKAAAELQDVVRKMEEEAPYVLPQLQNTHGVMTVRKYIEEHYMQEFWPNLKPGTRRGYKQIIHAHVIPQLGAQELKNIERGDIQRLINEVRSNEGVSRNTLNNIRTVCGSIFREAEFGKFLKHTPVYKIKMPPKEPKKKVAIPDVSLVQTVIDGLNEPYRTLVWFVATMGCRIGEAFGLKWGAVDFQGKRIWFLTARYAGVEEHLTKGHRADKPAYLTDFEVARLKAFKAGCAADGDDDLVFLDHGQPLVGQHCLRQELQRTAKKLGLNLTFHGLRHWAGTMLYRAGVPIKDIQARLGHARWQTTADWYIEDSDEGQQAAARIASSFLRSTALPPETQIAGSEILDTIATNSVTISEVARTSS